MHSCTGTEGRARDDHWRTSARPSRSAGIGPRGLIIRRVAGGYRVSDAPVMSLQSRRRSLVCVDLRPGGRATRNGRLRLLPARDPTGQQGHFTAREGTRAFAVLIRDVFVPVAQILADDAAAFIPHNRQGYVLLRLGMALGVAEGAAQSMVQNTNERSAAAHLPLGPSLIREWVAAFRLRATVRSDLKDSGVARRQRLSPFVAIVTASVIDILKELAAG